MIAEAESEGGDVVVIVRGEPGETRAMASDRAWAMVTMLGRGASQRDAGTASRAWVWTKHAGCTYPARSELRLVVDRTSVPS